ncbi:unnamed protein product [Symbiodinium natans]|uniref:Ubiquitin-like protease family profile domain-containing protein n=1 Tax=Symbiodinium natans TaxID=878477 RepID=A0A812N4C3_9DINO|nr:unnamed protein product [Symbiodinium natans]
MFAVPHLSHEYDSGEPRDLMNHGATHQGDLATPPACPVGMTDTTFTWGLQLLQRIASANYEIVPPVVSSELVKGFPAVHLLPPVPWSFRCLGILLPFVHQNHWTVLVLQVESAGLQATCFDGIPHRNAMAASQLANLIGRTWGMPCLSFAEVTLGTQKVAHTCGQIALAHCAILLRPLSASFEQFFRWADQLAQSVPFLPYAVFGAGGLSESQSRQLSDTLLSKGVPSENIAARIQAACSKVGVVPIATALASKHPWAALKAAAGKPGSAFRWVSTDELQAQIDAKASAKFGTTVPNGKSKKAKAKGVKKSGSPLLIDPSTLQMSPDSFSSNDGQPLCQLAMDEVQPMARGICFCTPAEVAPFLNNFKSISVDALGLLTTAALPAEAVGAAPVTALRYPAIYGPTQEAVLISGSLVQLGDASVQLTTHDIAEVEQLDTVVIKLSLYRDQCSIGWERICEAPIRALLQQVPELSLCQVAGCKQDSGCSRFHPAVEEQVDHLLLDIWGRQFQKLGGGREEPSQAFVFQAYIRVPASAVPHLHKITYPGLFFEPRAADGSGPHAGYAVVWLPGATAEEARHALRTCDKAIALTRLGSRFGVRVKETDEEIAFNMLRPAHPFVKVRISAKYKLHPLPFGCQRQALLKILQHWQWSAKPLQPDKGTAEGASWIVGASSEPPALALPLGESHVIVTKVQDLGNAKSKPPALYASSRTIKHIRYDDGPTDPAIDPWSDGQDPWAKARQQFAPPPGLSLVKSSQPSPGPSKLEQLGSELKQDLRSLMQTELASRSAGQDSVSSAQEARLEKLEVGMKELQEQNRKFEGWFATFGNRVSEQATTIQGVQHTLQSQSQDIHRLRSDVEMTVGNAVGQLQADMTQQLSAQLAGQLEQIQALFADKKPRTS